MDKSPSMIGASRKTVEKKRKRFSRRGAEGAEFCYKIRVAVQLNLRAFSALRRIINAKSQSREEI
jgi:hypothetical protein